MAEDNDQDKTEDPTPRRRQEAREEGNVPRSQDLASAALITGLLITLLMFGGRLLWSLRGIANQMLGAEELGRHNTGDLWPTLAGVVQGLAGGIAPIFVAVVLLAVLANVLQTGLVFSPKKLQPKGESLNPLKGFKRIFASAKTWVGLLMNLGKMGLAGAVAWFAIESELPKIVALQGLEFLPAVQAGASVVFSVGIKVALVLLVLAILDFAYQKYSHEQQLKMTRQQIKDEMKRMEGDPQIKQRRRQIAIQRAMQRINSEVPAADVVVTNPTHFSVAIKYDDGAMRAPRVVAKGADLLAFRIRELAAASGVPIVERAPLARALYRTVEVGQEIPEDFYNAVAELLAYVYQLDRDAAEVASG